MGRGSGTNINTKGDSTANLRSGKNQGTSKEEYDVLLKKATTKFSEEYAKHFSKTYTTILGEDNSDLAAELGKITEELVQGEHVDKIFSALEFEEKSDEPYEIGPTQKSREELTSALSTARLDYKRAVQNILTEKKGSDFAKKFCSDSVRYQPDLLDAIEGAISPRIYSIEDSIKRYPNRYKDSSTAVDFVFQDAFYKSMLGKATITNLNDYTTLEDKDGESIIPGVIESFEKDLDIINEGLKDGTDYFNVLQAKRDEEISPYPELELDIGLSFDFYWDQLAYSSDNPKEPFGYQSPNRRKLA